MRLSRESVDRIRFVARAVVNDQDAVTLIGDLIKKGDQAIADSIRFVKCHDDDDGVQQALTRTGQFSFAPLRVNITI
jgi:hypothetical protein